MTGIPPFFPDAILQLRDELNRVLKRTWVWLAEPGEWWTGEERLAIAAETLAARHCDLCEQRKAALSPYDIDRKHEARGTLPAAAVDAIHRIHTDPGRLGSRWYREVLESGLTEEQLVELIGIVACVAAIESVAGGLGAEVPDLPEPRSGNPARQRPVGARACIARVSTVPPEEAEGDLFDYYARMHTRLGPAPHIMQSLTLVPEMQIRLQSLMAELYLGPEMMEMKSRRTLTRPQMELIAAHVSAANECFY